MTESDHRKRLEQGQAALLRPILRSRGAPSVLSRTQRLELAKIVSRGGHHPDLFQTVRRPRSN